MNASILLGYGRPRGIVRNASGLGRLPFAPFGGATKLFVDACDIDVVGIESGSAVHVTST